MQGLQGRLFDQCTQQSKAAAASGKGAQLVG